MKVWELIAKLVELPAGADVSVATHYTDSTVVESVDFDKDNGVTLIGGDPNYIDNDGESQGPLSKLFEE